MYDYHLRQDILAEVHARPLQILEAPLSLVHIILLFDGLNGKNAEREVYRLLRGDGFSIACGHQRDLYSSRGQIAVRYEPHIEFYTLTLYLFDSLEPISLPGGWQEGLPGALLCGAEVILRRKVRNFMMHRSPAIPGWNRSPQIL